MASPERSRLRFWLLFAAAWTPFAAIYALLIAQSGAPTFDAIAGAMTTIATAAMLGGFVWRFAERPARPDLSRSRFLATHALLALAYATAWSAIVIASIYVRAPRVVLDAFLRNAAGWHFVSGLMLYAVIAGIAAAASAARRLREQAASAERSESLRVHAELQALRAQLDPHFLFNTLHSLMVLVRTNQRAAESALERLGDLLRYVLDVNRRALDDVPLADELAFVRNYLALEQLRFGARLRVIDEIDPDSLDCLVPTFTLQPLVENALRHGISPTPNGATLTLSSRVDEDRLVLEVRDDGAGAEHDAVTRASGLGVRAVRQRLDTRYGSAARVDIATSPGAGLAATLTLPARTGNETTHRIGRVAADVR